jgi:hypothetical protein
MALPHLRELTFWGMQRITPACLPALQAMSGLTTLRLGKTMVPMVDLTPEVRAAFDVERLRQGWPRLNLEWGDRR